MPCPACLSIHSGFVLGSLVTSRRVCVCVCAGGGECHWSKFGGLGGSTEEGRLLLVENNVYLVYLTLFRDLGLRRRNKPTGPHLGGFPVVKVKGTGGNVTEETFVLTFVAVQPRTTEGQGLHQHLHPHSHSGMI